MKFAYNRLDWLAAWEVGKFVELDGPSKVAFDSGFDSLWQWHRGTQLSAYASDLREIAEAAQVTLTREQIAGYFRRANEHGERLFLGALPPSARFLRALDDAQVRDLLEKMAEDRQEEAEEEAGRAPEESRQESGNNMARSLRRWLGPLSDAQGALVRDWAAARRDDPELWQRYGEQWGAAFERTLATRATPGFEERVREMFRDPQLPDRGAIRELRNHNRATYIGLLAQLAPTLSAEQRQHLRERLISIAEDFEDLAHQRQQAAGPGIIG